ncbi:MAG: anion permease [Oscillospiraceae bacterium]|nr:anion permease [Oscillospiraceae bacterium]
MNIKRLTCILIGPLLFLACWLFLPASVFEAASARAAVGTVAWMAFWWITGPVDFAVTAFLPIAMNALFQMTDMSAVIANYASETILLLLGASILTASWEETGLDSRIAAKFLSMIGSNLRQQIVFWFILCTVLSAILPNAVVCAAITPIAVSMLRYVGEKDIAKSKKGSLLLLTIAYATGVGGLASPLGGAMNLVTVDYLEQLTGQEYMYVSWVIRFLPITVVLVASNILMLMIGTKKTDELGGSKEFFATQYKSLPPMTAEEKWSLGLFLLATGLAFSRQFYQDYLPGLKPAYVFIICAILAFFVMRKDGSRLMKWKNTQKLIGWELIYVFAGGLAAGTLINKSGAADAIAKLVSSSNLDGGFITVLVIVTLTVLMSDVTSNTATAAVAMPIVIGIAQGINKDPIPYVYIASIGVNLSYMLPTSIRAIPVGYGLEPKYMLKKGIPITIVVILLMSLMGWLMMTYWPAFSTI